ncbi:hypothetical protein [Agrococcus casei]|uniref:hypothetical protein n=1 Tax=Agrococcus casei TaxID=343512 RepID=UPI003F925763
MTELSRDWQAEVLDWARTAPESEALPLSRVESKVRLAAGDLEKDLWALNVLEGLAWLAAIVAPAAFMAFQPTHGVLTGIETDTAVVIAGVCFALALLGPVLSMVRWLRRGRRRSGLTVWTNGFIAICTAAGLAFMFTRISVSGGAAGVWPAVGILTLAASLLVLGLQFLASKPSMPAQESQTADQMLQVRNEALGVLLRRGLIDDETHTRAVGTDFRQLHTVNDLTSKEQR